jgi:type I restriction enzyme S subunit
MSKQIEFKETSLHWCKEVPKEWGIKKIKYVSTIKNGATPLTSNPNFWDGDIFWATPVDVSKSEYIVKTERTTTEEGFKSCGTNKVPKGSIIITTRAPIGNISVAGVELCTNQGCKSIVPDNIHSKFAYYQAVVQKDWMKALGQGTTFTELSNENLSNIYFLIPPIEQQKSIAKFLDQKTTELDKLISQKFELINCLKEERIEIINQAVIGNLSNSTKKKPSGFDWVPTIPNDWTTNKIKNIAKIFGRIGYRGYQTSDLVNEGEGAITLSPSNMKEFQMDFTKCTYLSWFKYNESPEIQIENGDILFVKTGSTYGKTSLVKNLPEKATINPQLLVFKEVKINPEFFYFVLLSQLIQAQVSISVIGGTIPTISQEKIGNYYLFVPPIEEQDEIVALTNKHLEQTNVAIKKIEQEIDLINEYRAALINEAVTGKITLN